MRSKWHRRTPAAAIAVIALLLAGPVSAADPPRVAVVMSSVLGPFAEAMNALQDTLQKSVPQPELLTFDLEGKEGNIPGMQELVREFNPSVIITVGSFATAAVLAEPGKAPVVFSMVLYPKQSGFLDQSMREVTGASLDIPLDKQFQALRRLLPRARRVGVLYHGAETGEIVEQARKVAPGHGFHLDARVVERPELALHALKELLKDVDSVWTVADSHVFTAQTTPALILEALRSRIPVFGLSTAHVRVGALAALKCDYADVGAQTGELALRVVRGEKAQEIPPLSPRKIELALNLRTARHIGVSIDRDLEREALHIVK